LILPRKQKSFTQIQCRWINFAIFFLFSTSAYALKSVENEPQSPIDVIKNLSDEVQFKITSQAEYLQKNPRELTKTIESVFLPKVDFWKIGKQILGHHWRRTPPKQREKFISAFQKMLIRKFSSALLKQKKWQISFRKTRFLSRHIALVSSFMSKPGTQKISVQYKMYRNNSHWRIGDVKVEGISLVTTFRAAFSKVLRRKGIRQLIKNLKSF
jgi:phospholipid transport system substrate-binding protein